MWPEVECFAAHIRTRSIPMRQAVHPAVGAARPGSIRKVFAIRVGTIDRPPGQWYHLTAEWEIASRN